MPIPSLPRSGTPTTFLSTATQGATLTGTAGNDQLTAGALSVTLKGGAGDDTYYLAKASSGIYMSSTDVIEAAGAGIDTIISPSNYKLPANVEHLTLTNTGKFQYATGNGGDNIITGGTGKNYLATGGGNDVLYGGGGIDVFIPTKQAGSTTWIGDFGADDKLALTNFGFYSFTDVQAKMSQVGSDLKIDLGGGQSVMLASQSVSAITSSMVMVDQAVGARRLTFSDEFDGPLSLNTGTLATKGGTWKTKFFGGERTLGGNAELQIYVDPDYKGSAKTALGLNPFTVDDGVLAISARPADASVAPYLHGQKYTSGLLTTEASFQQQYGYFEIRAQDPAGKGLFPAFWLLSPGQWPPEIDIYEQIGSAPGYVSQGIATSTGPFQNKGTYTGVDMTKAFHTYALEWTSQKLTWFIDGKQTYQLDTPADMHQPMYVLLNLAVGGNWPGSPDATTNWATANLLVDYVRVYQLDGVNQPAPAPAPVPEPAPPAAPATTTPPAPAPTSPSAIALTNEMNPLDTGKKFDIALTGANTSTTYQIPLFSVNNTVPSVMAGFDGENKLILINNSAWNAVKNALVTYTAGPGATLKNFVDVELTTGGANDVINVTGIKRGNILSGDGNDTITIAGTSNGVMANMTKVLAGAGDDMVSFTAGWMNKVTLNGGDGNDKLTLIGGAGGTMLGGAGDDTLIDRSTGVVKATGGAGSDTFGFIKGVKATVTDYVAGMDRIELIGVSASQVHTGYSGADTVIDLGGGSNVRLTGVHLSQAQLDLHYV